VATTGDETLADERRERIPEPGPQTLADEQRRRIPAAAACIAAGTLTLAGGAATAVVFSDRPTVPVLDALREHLGTPGFGPGLKARQVLWVDANAVKLVLLGVLLALAALAIGVALAQLYRSVKARRPELPKGVFVALVLGTALLSVASLAQAIGGVIAASAFAGATDQSAAAARDAQASAAVVAAGLMQVVGVFALALAFVLLALNGMRVGLLTRFMGVLGIIVGALFIIPLGSSLPIVQAFWLVALGVLFLARWPTGMPPAWITGEAQPWPTQQELREARLERAGGDGEERPRRGGRRERAEPPETPAPEPPERRPHPSSKKRKRKRR
jgi:MFS family permease